LAFEEPLNKIRSGSLITFSKAKQIMLGVKPKSKSIDLGIKRSSIVEEIEDGPMKVEEISYSIFCSKKEESKSEFSQVHAPSSNDITVEKASIPNPQISEQSQSENNTSNSPAILAADKPIDKEQAISSSINSDKNSFKICKMTLPTILSAKSKGYPKSKYTCGCSASLVVEEGLYNRSMFIETLQSNFDINSDQAENGEKAIEKLMNQSGKKCCKGYQVVFVNVQVRSTKGLEISRVISQMIKDKKIKPTTVVALTPNCLGKHKDLRSLSGAQHSLRKPITIQDLQSVLDFCLGKAK